VTSLRALDEFGSFYGGVECLVEEEDTTRQPSSMTRSSQDRDRSRNGDSDGIPDSSDRCANNSHPRCIKEAT